jgi:D-alanine-D-alanine ligase
VRGIEFEDLSVNMRDLASRTLAVAPGIRLLFVTNLRPDAEAILDIGPGGVDNTAQFYTRRAADEIIRSLQELGVTVEAYFSELDLIRALVAPGPQGDERPRVVYSTAEGGRGPGRRALLPALCSLLQIPILNCGAHASSMVRHKFHAYSVLSQVGVRMPRTWQFARGHWTCDLAPPRGARVIVKPVYESMGIGVNQDSVHDVNADFSTVMADLTARFGQPAIAQEFVSGREVGVPVARLWGITRALPAIGQLRRDGSDFGERPKTFHDEQVAHDLSHSRFDGNDEQVAAMLRSAVLAFDALDMQGVGRIDFRVDADGRAWAFDTNGEPPPVPNTCWSAAMEHLGFSFSELLAVWLGICLADYGLLHESDQNDSSTQGINRP